ncbi:hypothetical protein ACTMLF_12390 [Proteus mirabilis]|uniref:hypothetical protein n=1 Tax=Proteus mirabilis TaxID=584 RepID=UPI0011407452|nr:hypothetical protein FKN07_12620 [Proteus mirabilis]HCZ9065869.1 hypothetical protein [Proteus mirabilis]
MIKKEKVIIKECLRYYLNKSKQFFIEKYGEDKLENNYFLSEIQEETDKLLTINLTLTEHYKLAIIVDENSSLVKDSRRIAFVLVSNVSYEEFSNSIQVNELELFRKINDFNLRTCGIQCAIADYSKYILSFSSDFTMHYGLYSNDKQYKKIFLDYINNAFREVSKAPDDIAKSIGLIMEK